MPRKPSYKAYSMIPMEGPPKVIAEKPVDPATLPAAPAVPVTPDAVRDLLQRIIDRCVARAAELAEPPSIDTEDAAAFALLEISNVIKLALEQN